MTNPSAGFGTRVTTSIKLVADDTDRSCVAVFRLSHRNGY